MIISFIHSIRTKIFYFTLFFVSIYSYQCPKVQKFQSNLPQYTYSDIIPINGSNLLLATLTQTSQMKTYIHAINLSTNECAQFAVVNDMIAKMGYSEGINQFYYYIGNVIIKDMQKFNTQKAMSNFPSTVYSIKKSTINTSQLLLVTNTFTAYYFDLSSAKLIGNSFPSTPLTSSTVSSYSSRDHQLTNFQVLSITGIGRIDLYNIQNGNLIISKSYTGSGTASLAVIVEILNSNTLLVSYGTTQLYLWQLSQNLSTGQITVQEVISINLIRFQPQKMSSFIASDGQSYISLMCGNTLIDFLNNIDQTYRDIYLLHYIASTSTIEIKEAYPFTTLLNQNNWANSLNPLLQVLLTDIFSAMQACTFIPSSQRVYGISYDAHYIFPFLESSNTNQCDFDQDGVIDSYCRLPILINQNNLYISNAFFVLNDGNIFIANNLQTGFRIFSSASLMTVSNVIPNRNYEECSNCVQRLKTTSPNPNFSSNVKPSTTDDIFVFPMRFSLIGMSLSLTSTWQSNQGVYIYDYTTSTLSSVNLSAPMAIPSNKIFLSWKLVSAYKINNLIYSCLSYNYPTQSNIQTGYYTGSSQISSLQSYFSQHNIECYTINSSNAYQSTISAEYSQAINYSSTSQSQFSSICDVSYSTTEFICINGLSQLNIWTMDTLVWKRSTSITQCTSPSSLTIYVSSNIPYLFIACSSNLAVVDSTNLANIFYILNNTRLQSLMIQNGILLAGVYSTSEVILNFYNVSSIIQSKTDSPLLNQFIDPVSATGLAQIDFQMSTSKIYVANTQAHYIIDAIDPLFYDQNNLSCDINVYYSYNNQNNLLTQKQSLITQSQIGYPLTYGGGTVSFPYQNQAQLIEGVYLYNNFVSTFNLAIKSGTFQVNYILNVDNAKQNPLIDQLFTWNFSTDNFVINALQTIPNQSSTVIVNNQVLNIGNWQNFVLNNLLILLNQPASSLNTVQLLISGCNNATLNSINLHQIPNVPANQQMISTNLITSKQCNQILINGYSINSYNITSTDPLFLIQSSTNATITNLSISNSFIENTPIYTSTLNELSLITNSIINSNTFCSYNFYQAYQQQLSTLTYLYNAITFSTNLNVNNLNITSNKFCTNTNFIFGSSQNIIYAQNSNMLTANNIIFSNNNFLTGILLQNILYSFSLSLPDDDTQPVVQIVISGIQFTQNQQINFSLPSTWSVSPQSGSPQVQQQSVLQKQNVLCSYFKISDILYFEINNSSIIDESFCGMLNLQQVYSIKLNTLNFTNTKPSTISAKRDDILIYVQESAQISITNTLINNMNFENSIAIELSLEQFITNSITISNNTFQNVNITQLNYYIQVNLIYISVGDSNAMIVLNDNTFLQIMVSFSTSSQTLSSSCIASNSQVGSIVMNRNTFNDTYSDSTSGALVLNAQNISISSSIFSNNLYSQINVPTLSQDIQVNGGFIKAITKSISIQNSTFTDCVTQYGAVYITPSDMQLFTSITNCSFINLIAYSSGSAIYLEGAQNSLGLNITSSYFSNIYLDYSSNYKGSIKAAVHIDANQNALPSNNIILMSNLKIENVSGMNTLGSPSFFFSVGQATVTANQIQVTRFIVNVYAYIRIFNSVQISNNVQIYSSLFSVFSNSVFKASQVSINEPNVNDLIHSLQSANIVHPALLYLSGSSSFSGTFLNFTGLKSNAQGGLIYAENSLSVAISYLNSSSTNMSLDSTLQINQNLPYQNIWNSLLNYQSVSNILISDSLIYCADSINADTLKHIPTNCQGRVVQAYQSLINIYNSTFQNYQLQSGNGTGLSLVNMQGQNNIQNVTFANFINNQNGGAIFVYSNFNTKIDNSVTLSITNTTFQNNTVSQQGGAIAFENDPTSTVIQTIELNIKDSVFFHNNATIAGCIFYNNFIPSISGVSNIFMSNTAQMGNIIYSQPRMVKLINSNEIIESSLVSSNNYTSLVRTSGTNLQLLHASGQELPTFTFKLYFYDSPTETVSADTEKEVLIHLLNAEQISQQVLVSAQQNPQPLTALTTNIPYTIQGQSNVFINTTGNFIYLNINLWSTPDFDMDLMFNFTMVKTIDTINNRINSQYDFISQIYNRNCSQFETISSPQNVPLINLSPNITQCNKCPNLTFAYQQTICQECPVGAACRQDENIGVQSSYWRRGFDTYQILQCDGNYNSCNGGSSVGNDLCKEGYIGALCEECDLFAIYWSESYAKQGQYSCVKCNEMVLSYLILLTLSGFTIIFAAYSIESITHQIHKKIAHTIVEKFRKRRRIQLQQLQQQQNDQIGEDVIIQNQNDQQQESNHQTEHNHSSGAQFKIFASYLQVLGSLSSFNISMPTFFPQVSSSIGSPVRISVESMDCFLRYFTKDVPYHFFKYILSLTIPLWYYLILLIILKIQSKLKKEKFQMNYLYSGALFLFIYLQPDLVQQGINLMSCVQIGDELYILSNLNEYCYTSLHIKYITYLLIPAILVWLLILPLKLLLLLKKNRFNLERIHFRMKWAFLYHEYTTKSYAWELVKMYEKLIIVIALSIFNSQYNVKVSLITIILIVYTYLLLKQKPYREAVDNQMELYATLSCIITMVFVVLVIQAGLNPIIQVIALSCMILVNFLTLSIMVLRMLLSVFKKLNHESKIFEKHPTLQKKITSFFNFCSRYIFKEDEQVSFQNDGIQNHSSPHNQDSIQGSPTYLAQQMVAQQFSNNNASQTIDQSVFHNASNHQLWYQKFRANMNKQNTGASIRNKTVSIQQNDIKSSVRLKTKSKISLQKILNFSIQPHFSQAQIGISQLQQEQPIPKIFSLKHLTPRENEGNQIRQEYDPLYSPVLQPFSQQLEQAQTNYSVSPLKAQQSRVIEPQNISNLEDQNNLFIISDSELALPVSPKSVSSHSIQKVYASKPQPIVFK